MEEAETSERNNSLGSVTVLWVRSVAMNINMNIKAKAIRKEEWMTRLIC